ncbi:MAG: Fumarylacetoacetase, partial [uncultured Gemmatimonadaceae bacterium]
GRRPVPSRDAQRAHEQPRRGAHGAARRAEPAAARRRPALRARGRGGAARAERRGRAARPGGDRRLHRLLRVGAPRHQRGADVPARRPAAAQLQVRPDRLPRARLLDRREWHAGASPARAAPPRGGQGAALRPHPHAGL